MYCHHPPPEATLFSHVAEWGPEEGHFKNSQVPYYRLFCLLYLWLWNTLKPYHITNKFSSTTSLKHPLDQFSHPVLQGSMCLQNVRKYKVHCVVWKWSLNVNWTPTFHGHKTRGKPELHKHKSRIIITNMKNTVARNPSFKQYCLH